ncbi:hypothetical protein [Candidatus Mycolicibacterium alkanivorans]|uniref:Uncharacterized protein n=1 Tax=Candidatus Mycolicibacterium alkanivorans TaxID=2954114 RepID=A0ABS9YU03_9MYCO|nr:hypothetical protein [Candidatus Mycolicibacterium alkanivorans]MCI4674691.1 hypothetical protein [Candidatus Mycolicibacterium alkanivorans]
MPQPDDTRTGIIRRAPTGPIPPIAEGQTTHIPPLEDVPTGLIRRAEPMAVPARAPAVIDISTGRTAVAASAVSIISGWATAVVATDLITGWWRTDRLFCVAVGFLTLLFAGTTISGVILLLLRRSVGRYLVTFGAVVALMTFGSVFLAGARIPWPVYLIPVLPLASLALALHSSTKRWCRVR